MVTHSNAIALSAALVLAMLSPVRAQQGPQWSPQDKAGKPASFEEAVIRCVAHVRQAVGGNRFDAHVDSRGQVRSSGNDDEKARFTACMQQAGYPIKPNSG